MRIAIVGAGAAGCFAAINLKRMCPRAEVTIYESGRKPLAKVAVTGGGRCNLTNSFERVRSLTTVYPRGERLMKRLLREFSHEDAYRWFESEGVRLVTQDDCCVFPQSQDAMEIVGTLVRLIRRNGIELKTGHRVTLIERNEDDNGAPVYVIRFADGTLSAAMADAVIVTTGGSPKTSGLDMLRPLNVKTVAPVPSLFSVCLPADPIRELTGTVVENASVALTGTKMRADGPLLITHWGLSGPAILKLSSYAARVLAENGYKATLSVNWTGDGNETDTLETITGLAVRNPQKQLASVYPPYLNARLWTHLLSRSGLNASMRWAELGRKGMNRLVNTLTNSHYRMDGKNRFKEEFVTCGGVALEEINPQTLESRTSPGLYFAGEVLDVDAITGGFNLQAAWTMGYVVAKAVSGRHQT